MCSNPIVDGGWQMFCVGLCVTTPGCCCIKHPHVVHQNIRVL